jgi:prevent-host-death family protein
MKVIAVREAKQQLSGCIDTAQKERILITKHGRPVAVVIGVEGRDFEDILLMQNPRFWELIEERRKQPTLSLAAVRKRFGLAGRPARRRRR